MRLPVLRPFAAALLALTVAACRSGGDADRLRLDLERRDPGPVLRTYFGAYLGPDGGDPVAAGLLEQDGETFYVRASALRERVGSDAPPLDPDGDGTVTDDELGAFVQATYNAARGFPATLAALGADTSSAFGVTIRGVMSAAPRRVFVPLPALRDALAGYRRNGQRIVYPAGTVIWGAHGDGDGETTAMRKRADGAWDFFVYDAQGRLATTTNGAPRPLRAPTQCVGCHFGQRLFEPEKSFPGEATPGPDGPRALYTEHRDAAVVQALDEHRRRADHVLGLYGTLYATRLKAARAAGTLAPEDAALLDSLGM
ncbi:MAG TPA: hypothetical protein VD948_04050 [Rhodothermales bacterium]|nr:hypothetical protein [Rhodothermales bacterium]